MNPSSVYAALVTSDEANSVRIYKKIAPVTVLIASAYVSHHHLQGAGGTSIGSGVLLDGQGSIVTNAHVVEGAARITVMLHDGMRLPAELIGSDPVTDLALLRVALPKEHQVVAQLGDSDRLEVGQKVLAVGHPFGLGYALTSGVISGFGKTIGPGGIFSDRVIQTTAAINPGNSGGPLVDSEDRVVGINTAVLLGAQNISFAVPINTVKAIVAELRAEGRIVRPWLGITGKLLTGEVKTLIALPLVDGFVIGDVEDGSPAERSGLRQGNLDITIEGEPWVLGGDILVAVNGQDVKTAEQYGKMLKMLKAGQTIDLKIYRDESYHTISVKLDERPTPQVPPERPKTTPPLIVPQVYQPTGF
jgi:S1-C subfamily serine protease